MANVKPMPQMFLTRPENDASTKGGGSMLIKSALLEAGMITTLHGVPHMLRTKYTFVKLLWLIALVCSTAICAVLIVQSIVNYLEFGVVTRTQTQFQSPTYFPQVAICNLNFFTTDSGGAFVLNQLHKNNFSSFTSSNGLYSTAMVKFYMGSTAFLPEYSDDFRRSLGTTIDDLLITCIYNLTPCNSSSFEWFWDIVYGSCYKFNAHGKITSDKAGTSNGLQIELFVGPSTPLSFSISTGAHVMITNSTSPKQLFYFSGIDVPTGAFTSIGVGRVKTKQLAQPYSDCLDNINTRLSRMLMDAYGYYEQTRCYDICFQEYLIKKCKCRNVVTKDIAGLNGPYCTTLEKAYCEISYYSEFTNSSIKNSCQAECPLECEKINYQLTTSTATYPTRTYVDTLTQNQLVLKHYGYNKSAITYESLKENILALNVFYPELSYTLVEESADNLLIDLIGSIGGQLGLFIGISFLSFMELVDMSLTLAINAFKLLSSHQRLKNRTSNQRDVY